MIHHRLFQSTEGKVAINPAFVDFNDIVTWSPQRAIEVLWQTAFDVLYKKDVEAGRITMEFVENKLQGLNHAYGGVKHKFQDVERNNGGRYFDHQLRVAYNILTKSKKPSLRKVLIALHHDSIEDTDYDFHTLETTFNDKIALGVQIISKRPFTEFAKSSTNQSLYTLTQSQKDKLKHSKVVSESGLTLSDWYLKKRYQNPTTLTAEELSFEQMWRGSLSDREKFEIIELSGILNRKGLLSDKYISKRNFKPEHITLEEKFAEELYEELSERYKNIRNSEYFSHMFAQPDEENILSESRTRVSYYPCMHKFYNHALKSLYKERKKMDHAIVESVVLDALEVKFRDRIDNLQTTEVYKDWSPDNFRKAKRKIEETKKYFYTIAKEFDDLMGTGFYKIISGEVKKLENYMMDQFQKDTQISVLGVIEKKS